MKRKRTPLPTPHEYWICLGTNFNAEQHLNLALNLLHEFLPILQAAPPTQTAAHGLPPGTPDYTNCVVRVHSLQPLTRVQKLLKHIEHVCGRRPCHKGSPIMPIDIDLLCMDRHILKPSDWQRDYIAESVHKLQLHHPCPLSILQREKTKGALK